MTKSELAKADVTVVGMGKSGLAAVALLRGKTRSLIATDTQALADIPQVKEQLGRWGVPFAVQSEEVFRDKDLIIISPGVPADLVMLTKARARGTVVIGEVELAGTFLQGPSIGITGSNGKTTTTALTAHILRESGVPVQIGGNIGDPLTNMVESSRPGQWNVLELSSFQLETIETFRVEIAAILNLTQDHLDRHHTMDAYAEAKRRIVDTQVPGDAVVLNADDALCREIGEEKPDAVWFSSSRAVSRGLWIEQDVIVLGGQPLMELAGIPLRGLHNVENAMAAAAAAHLAGVGPDAIAAAIRTFPGVAHRLEFVRTLGGVDYYNDSKATNVDATMKALDAFRGGLWVILGGKDKGSDYTVLRRALRAKAKHVLLVGAAAGKIASHLGDAVSTVDCQTIEEAVAFAHSRAAAGDTVLLAPACASFDQFRSFEHRGDTFKSLVAALEVKP